MNTQSNHILRATLLALAAGIYAQAHVAGETKNVIFFLDDGMGPTTVAATRIYKVGEARRLMMESLKRTARIKTYSNSMQTTDSTSSMSAYMTGVKMNNGVISISADTKTNGTTGRGYVSGTDSTCPANNDTPTMALLGLAKIAGKSVGAVTTARVTHATPAAIYSHICYRDGKNQIVAQGAPSNALYNTAPKDGLDMLLGGGRHHYLPRDATGNRCTDMTDLTAQFQVTDCTYVPIGTRLTAVDPATINKLLGLFDLNHMNYELDRMKKSVDEPNLVDMTRKAIRVPQKNGKSYLLMMEGGRIGHTLHGTSAKCALEDVGALDETIKRALDTADLPNTLIVVTANRDHTMVTNGYPHKGNPILGVSNDTKTGQLQSTIDGLLYATLMFDNGGTARETTHDNVTAVDTAADDYLQEMGVQLGTPDSETHGDEDVMPFSSSPGSAPLEGTLDNTKVFGVVKMAMGF